MRSTLVLTTLLLVAAPVAARAADRVVLLPATGANVEDGELAAATDLLRVGLEQTGRFAVVIGHTPGGYMPEATPVEAGHEARAAGATLAVTLRISRLGSAASARLAAYRQDGSVWHADALTAATPDDLEPVLQRLAQGLSSARPAADLATIDTVTDRESREPRRVPASFDIGLRFGGSWIVDRPGGGTGRISGVGVFWLYDARSFLAEAAIDWHGGGGDHVLETGVAAYLPFTRENVTPYAGVGLGYALVHTDDDTDAGLEVKGMAGLLLGRLSTVRIRIEGGWRTTLFNMSVNGEREAVQGPFATAGIGF